MPGLLTSSKQKLLVITSSFIVKLYFYGQVIALLDENEVILRGFDTFVGHTTTPLARYVPLFT